MSVCQRMELIDAQQTIIHINHININIHFIVLIKIHDDDV